MISLSRYLRLAKSAKKKTAVQIPAAKEFVSTAPDADLSVISCRPTNVDCATRSEWQAWATTNPAEKITSVRAIIELYLVAADPDENMRIKVPIEPRMFALIGRFTKYSQPVVWQ